MRDHLSSVTCGSRRASHVVRQPHIVWCPGAELPASQRKCWPSSGRKGPAGLRGVTSLHTCHHLYCPTFTDDTRMTRIQSFPQALTFTQVVFSNIPMPKDPETGGTGCSQRLERSACRRPRRQKLALACRGPQHCGDSKSGLSPQVGGISSAPAPSTREGFTCLPPKFLC